MPLKRNILIVLLDFFLKECVLTHGQVSAPVVPADISISGLNLTSRNEGIGYIGDAITCSANCNPPAHLYTWTLLNTNEDFNSDTVTLAHEGLLSYQCTAFNNVSGIQHNASVNFRLNVLPAQATCRSAEITFTGINKTSTTQGIGRVGDYLICSSQCIPAAISHRLTLLNSNEVFHSGIAQLTTEGVSSYQCAAVFDFYMVSANIRVHVLPAAVTCSSASLLIAIAGVTLISTTNATGRVGDTMSCSASCSPKPNTYTWTQLDSGEIYNSAHVYLASEGNFDYRCSAASESYSVARTIRVQVNSGPASVILQSSLSAFLVLRALLTLYSTAAERYLSCKV